MKHQLQLGGVLLLLASSAMGQMASHAPTAIAKQASLNSIQAPTGKPIVRVNGTVLTDQDLLRGMIAIFPYARQHGGFPKQLEPDIRRGALQMIEFEELVYQDAQRRKMTVPPARVDKAMAEFRKQFSSEQEYQEYLKVEQGGSRQQLREHIQRSLLIDQYLDLEVNRKAVVSEKELRSDYDKNPAAFLTPESVSIQTISIVIPDNAPSGQQAEIRKRAEDALRQAKATKNYEGFGLLAEKISEDNWHVMMGDHHSVTRDKMPPPVANAAFSMKVGEVSDLIRAENSWCIVRLNGHEPASQASFDEVKAGLRDSEQKKKVEALRAALDRKLRETSKVQEL